jgi:class 3 adenylate cyclase
MFMTQNSHLPLKQNPVQGLSSSQRPDRPGRDSVQRKIAVLFTDIVGSSMFFKTQGDLAGRKMLKKHQDFVSPAINEYGGVVVKVLGDSVMAYFLNAQEALKSAIKIQQTLHRYNINRKPQEQIRVRICVHFGKGIIEEKDIFGDVVNTAAKFLPLVEGDQIVVSQPVVDLANDLPKLQFKPVSISDQLDSIRGMALFQVQWEEGLTFTPADHTLLYIRPLANFGRGTLSEAWSNLIKSKNRLWVGKTDGETVLPDKSIVLLTKTPQMAMTLATHVMDFLKINLGQDGVPFLPVQIIIDAGPYLRAGRLYLENLKVPWETIEPGEIYLSAKTHGMVQKNGSLSLGSLAKEKQGGGFFKLGQTNPDKGSSARFLYQNALIQGSHSPCFYCGDMRHSATHCPSKEITDITRAMDQLGYLPFEEINRLYFNHLNKSRPEKNGASSLAYQAFFELKAMYQLRFFSTVWNQSEENWNRVKESKDDKDKGGLVWIALDCIRVSNLDQASSILEDYTKKTNDDYKAYCTTGFLNIEKNQQLLAKHYFKLALRYAKTMPQKVLLHFLIARLYELGNNLIRAEEEIRKILRLNPYCPEALYQEAIYKFRRGREATALRQLLKLIGTHREYYISAMIDPELANYGKTIHPDLEKLYLEKKDEAKRMVEQAEKVLNQLKESLGEEESEVPQAQSLWDRIKELSDRESYFSYEDIIYYASTIIHLGHQSVEVRRRKLLRVLREQKGRIGACLEFVTDFPYEYLTESVRYQLKRMKTVVDKEWETSKSNVPEKFTEAIKRVEKVSKDLTGIEAKLQRLDKARQMIAFMIGFFKKSLIFQSASLLLAIMVFPLMTHYLNFLIPELNITPHNIWGYQKGILLVGGLSGILLSIVACLRELSKD